MAPQSRRKTISIVDKLYKEPWRFSFFQAVRLIQNVFNRQGVASSELSPVASDVAAKGELVKFSSAATLAYSTSDVLAVKKEATDNLAKTDVQVSFMGLAGISGALPSHYTDFILQRQRAKDTAMRDFFNLFNHRAISLFYRASEKHHLAYSYEAYKVHGKSDTVDPITNALLALIGRRVTAIDTASSVRLAENRLFFGGIYAASQCSPVALAALLSEQFNVPIFVEQFIGEWAELHADDRISLGDYQGRTGANNCLGMNAIIGTKVYCVESRFRIIIGSLSRHEFEQMKPGSEKLHALVKFTRNYIGPNLVFDLKIKLDMGDASCARLSCGNGVGSSLGWDTWLVNRDEKTRVGRVTEINLSSQSL